MKSPALASRNSEAVTYPSEQRQGKPCLPALACLAGDQRKASVEAVRQLPTSMPWQGFTSSNMGPHIARLATNRRHGCAATSRRPQRHATASERRGNNLKQISRLLPERQRQNPAVTGLYILCQLDSGSKGRLASHTHTTLLPYSH